MRLIKLTHDVTVAAHSIIRLQVLDHGVRVYTSEGEVTFVGCDYGKTAYDTQARLVDEINKATMVDMLNRSMESIQKECRNG